MRKLEFLFYDPRLFFSAFFIIFLALPCLVYFSISGKSNAMNNSYPPAYTGGAPVSKVLQLNDGGTVTITCTGAVIKSPADGSSAYREGWVNTADINNINSGSDLNGTGRIKSGSSNPYGSSNICPSQSTSSQSSNKQTSNKAYTSSKTSNSSKSKNNNTSANNPVMLAGDTTYSTPSQPAQTTYTQPAAASATALPNTGPGDVLAVGGLTTVFSSVGHYLYQRRRYS